ncbi:MAG: hypothetical protein E7620_08765 [Ruminococcaceae bacterium]|nr:hypothetical protein [Oscillospiraceae bacterium]
MLKRMKFPAHAYLPLLCVILLNSLTYFGTKIFLPNAAFHNLGTRLDELLPFVPFFSLFYVLAYLQWGLNYWLHAYGDRDDYYQLCTADILAKLLCLVLFLALPVTIERPTPSGNGFFNGLTALIYRLDSPTNLFPSIHCVESWIAFRAARVFQKAPRGYATAHLILAILVFASTVLIRQHFLADVVAGVIVVEIGWLLSSRLGIWRIFHRLQPSWGKRAENHDRSTP